jgi:hypothetical protein
MAPGVDLSLTEMSTRGGGGKGRPARKADNLTAICSRLSRICRGLGVSQPYYRPSRPVTGIVLSLYLIMLLSTKPEDALVSGGTAPPYLTSTLDGGE